MCICARVSVVCLGLALGFARCACGWGGRRLGVLLRLGAPRTSRARSVSVSDMFMVRALRYFITTLRDRCLFTQLRRGQTNRTSYAPCLPTNIARSLPRVHTLGSCDSATRLRVQTWRCAQSIDKDMCSAHIPHRHSTGPYTTPTPPPCSITALRVYASAQAARHKRPPPASCTRLEGRPRFPSAATLGRFPPREDHCHVQGTGSRVQGPAKGGPLSPSRLSPHDVQPA